MLEDKTNKQVGDSVWINREGKKSTTYSVLHQPRPLGTRLGLGLANHIPRRLGLDRHLVWAGYMAPGLGQVGDDASVWVTPRQLINQSLSFINTIPLERVKLTR
jgi:hypothetical protein